MAELGGTHSQACRQERQGTTILVLVIAGAPRRLAGAGALAPAHLQVGSRYTSPLMSAGNLSGQQECAELTGLGCSDLVHPAALAQLADLVAVATRLEAHGNALQ